MAKKVTIDELRQLTVPELQERLVLTRKELFALRIKRAELKNPLKLRWLRRNVARILTLVKEKTAGGKIEESR